MGQAKTTLNSLIALRGELLLRGKLLPVEMPRQTTTQRYYRANTTRNVSRISKGHNAPRILLAFLIGPDLFDTFTGPTNSNTP